ncbi:hypothetical protein GIB67_020889 [Kingdonia uniflora]|uniref:Uncharacterized protein n=1 Tax=Kingdonia uniflora TaxID=39325 RepID=A0A7J7M7G2_9MAGN|nr:hypothetical protein GIB67_020889 [Kingdonia uniflora]
MHAEALGRLKFSFEYSSRFAAQKNTGLWILLCGQADLFFSSINYYARKNRCSKEQCSSDEMESRFSSIYSWSIEPYGSKYSQSSTINQNKVLIKAFLVLVVPVVAILIAHDAAPAAIPTASCVSGSTHIAAPLAGHATAIA